MPPPLTALLCILLKNSRRYFLGDAQCQYPSPPSPRPPHSRTSNTAATTATTPTRRLSVRTVPPPTPSQWQPPPPRPPNNYAETAVTIPQPPFLLIVVPFASVQPFPHPPHLRPRRFTHHAAHPSSRLASAPAVDADIIWPPPRTVRPSPPLAADTFPPLSLETTVAAAATVPPLRLTAATTIRSCTYPRVQGGPLPRPPTPPCPPL